MKLGLFALAIGAFGIGTTEFVIVGLLPEVAADLGVSIPAAGLLVSGYALSVVIGAPLLTAAGSQQPRRRMLIILMAIFVAGNLVCALASGYSVLMIGRVIAALCHGAFFGIGSVAAADLVGPEKRARAVAMMFAGLTVANVLGVPLGTALGQTWGWRSTFWAVTALGVIGMVALLTLLPNQPVDADGSLRKELAAFRDRQVWLALVMTTLGFAGVFAAFTYIAPMMIEVAGFPPGAVSWLLILFGAGLCVGNVVGGRLADRAVMPTLYGVLVCLAAVLFLFVLTSRYQIPAAITIVLFGAAGFASVPALQLRVMSKSTDAPALASAANIAAFNLGNALGAWLGGLSISAGFGYTAPNVVGGLLALSGLAVALYSGGLDRRARHRSASPVRASDR